LTAVQVHTRKKAIRFRATDTFIAAERKFGLEDTDWKENEGKGYSIDAMIPAEMLSQAVAAFKKEAGKDLDSYDVRIQINPNNVTVTLRQATLFAGKTITFQEDLIDGDMMDLELIFHGSQNEAGVWPDWYGITASTVSRLADTLGNKEAEIGFYPVVTDETERQMLHFSQTGTQSWHAVVVARTPRTDDA